MTTFQSAVDPGWEKPRLYRGIAEQAQALVAGEADRIANAANISALIYHSLPDVNWAGFYFYDGAELVVGPFQGLPACVRIPLGKGVCGTAAATRETQLVEDVAAFPGHIACDAASKSEIVAPIVVKDTLVGVLDIDSPSPARFDEEDREGLERIAAIFAATLEDSNEEAGP